MWRSREVGWAIMCVREDEKDVWVRIERRELEEEDVGAGCRVWIMRRVDGRLRIFVRKV